MKKLLAAVVVLSVFWAFGQGDEEPTSDAASPDSSSQAESATDRSGDASAAGRDERAEPGQKRRTKQPGASQPKPAPSPRSWLVTRVIDGDTIELGNGADVRIVGIDTPERGECGYDAATNSMSRLVLGKQVRLTVSDEDTDGYGRWLRYVDVGPIDAGLRQIKDGFAIARYDSRDGYGYHEREPAYIRADDGHKNPSCAKPAQKAPKPAGGGCASGYSPCLPSYPPDVDCADVNGPIRVTGSDPHGLDADGDGVACE